MLSMPSRREKPPFPGRYGDGSILSDGTSSLDWCDTPFPGNEQGAIKMSTAKQAYRALCNSEPSILVISKAWWLDAAAGSENWDVVIVEREGEIVASLPFVIKRLLGLTLLTQPSLTQTLGPWLKPTSLKSSKLLSWEKEQMQALIAQLPPYSHYVQQWHYSYSNWLPFYWKGFTQTTRYTFVIDDLSDIASVYAGFSHAKRYEIRKAEKHIRIAFDLSAEEFYENHKM